MILFNLKDKITALDFYGNHFDYNYLLWIFYVIAGDFFGIHGRNYYIQKYNIKDEAERKFRMTMQYTLADENFALDEKLRGKTCSNLHQDFITLEYGTIEFVNDFATDPFPTEENEDEIFWSGGRSTWIDGTNIALLVSLSEHP